VIKSPLTACLDGGYKFVTSPTVRPHSKELQCAVLTVKYGPYKFWFLSLPGRQTEDIFSGNLDFLFYGSLKVKQYEVPVASMTFTPNFINISHLILKGSDDGV
jgi:hypothetical protein